MPVILIPLLLFSTFNALNEDEYLNAWQQFQYRYSYLLPSINIGINPNYILFNNEKINGFEKAYTVNWYEALLYYTIIEI